MKKYIYIEDESILDIISVDHNYCYITDDPVVTESLSRQNIEVYNVSKHISKEYLNQSSIIAAKLCYEWVQVIDKYYQNLLGKELKIGTSINTYLYNYIATSFYTYISLDYLKSNNIKTLIHYHEESVSIKEKKLITRDLTAEIARLSMFENFFDTYSHGRINKKDDKGYNVITKFNLKYLFYYLLGFLSVPTKIKYLSAGLAIKERIKYININFIDKLPNKKHTILILHTGEQIEYNARKWRKKGSLVAKCNLYQIVTQTEPQITNNKLVSELLDNLPEDYDEIMGKDSLDFISLLSSKISKHIAEYVLPTYNHIDKQIVGDNLPKNLLVVSGSWDMEQSLLSYVLSKYNIPTIVFQEGTACLHEFYRYLVPVGYIMHGDAFVSRALHEEKYFKSRTQQFDKAFFCYGSLKMQQSRYPFLAQILARKIWGIKNNTPVVLYAPARFQSRVIRPYRTFTDMEYWNYQKDFILKGLANVNKNIYIKIQKKGLISSPYTSCSVWSLLNLPDNVSIKESPDLRFMRFAADIIIVDFATSTLSWALTSNKPVVFMHNKINPLQDQVYQAAKRAFFLIDIEDNSKWISDIQTLLNKPLRQIRIKWDSMKSQREIFMEDYVVGPNASDDELYDWMVAQ